MSANKRKAKLATPMKLTPEKAKSSDLNFFHMYHEAHKAVSSALTTPQGQSLTTSQEKMDDKMSPVVVDVQSTPLEPRSKQSPTEKQSPGPGQRSLFPGLKTNSAAEVTPTLDVSSPSRNIPSSAPDYVSPRLRRLISSAQKARATSTHANLQKKSFSTPRKKKHVRSLCFGTPPSLKNIETPSPRSPSSRKITNSHGVSISMPRKRKLEGEESERYQAKSKKRLQW